jgi:hypothetical protein
MTGRPSIVSDYVSIILRTIEKTQNDPARLRTLVYDVARLSLGKHVLTTYHQIGSAGLQQHISDLETAINHVEDISQKQIEDFSKKVAAQAQIADLSKKVQEQIADLSKKAQEQIADLSKKAQEQIADSSDQSSQEQIADISNNDPSEEQKDAAADLAAQLLEGQVSTPDQNGLTVRDWFDEKIFDESRSNETAVVVQPLPTEVYVGRAEVLEPLDFRIPAFGSGPKRRLANSTFGVQLAIAMVIGIGIYVASLVAFDYTGGHFSITEQNVPTATVPANAAAKLPAIGAEALGFPLPRVYGVYAVSEGKLYELDPLAMKVPDVRVAISAMISSPSQVTLPQGKIQFVIFRRDLVASAPTEVFVRVVARVAREMKFTGAGPPTTTNIDGEWAIRSKSYTLRVAPLGDSPEMVTLRSSNPDFSLSPGRYVLVLAGKGYDFTIDGQVTDLAQCLERTNVVGGIVYSECGAAASRPTN